MLLCLGFRCFTYRDDTPVSQASRVSRIMPSGAHHVPTIIPLSSGQADHPQSCILEAISAHGPNRTVEEPVKEASYSAAMTYAPPPTVTACPAPACDIEIIKTSLYALEISATGPDIGAGNTTTALVNLCPPDMHGGVIIDAPLTRTPLHPAASVAAYKFAVELSDRERPRRANATMAHACDMQAKQLTGAAGLGQRSSLRDSADHMEQKAYIAFLNAQMRSAPSHSRVDAQRLKALQDDVELYAAALKVRCNIQLYMSSQ